MGRAVGANFMAEHHIGTPPIEDGGTNSVQVRGGIVVDGPWTNASVLRTSWHGAPGGDLGVIMLPQVSYTYIEIFSQLMEHSIVVKFNGF